MKQEAIHALCQIDTPAPALNRGMAVMLALGQEASASLEELTDKLALPKSSIFRLLQTLEQMHMVRKLPSKRYEALWGVHPLAIDAATNYRQRIARLLPSLCETTDCTVEWYESSQAGMTLINQCNPESELRVQARPGFVRRWGDEFEAVARLAYAFSPDAPALVPLELYTANGVLEKISRKQATDMLTEDRRQRAAADAPFNGNGVRRCAVAVFDPDSNAFLGILALAQVFQFANQTPIDSLLGDLRKATKTL